MATTARRTSTMPTSTNRDVAYKAKDKDAPKKEIWSSMLDGASSGKKLPEKTAFVLGGTRQTQHDFLALLDTSSPRNSNSTNRRNASDRSTPLRPPVATSFALGYTYQDVLDAEQDDTLARLSLYLLHASSTAFVPLLRPLLTPLSIPHAVFVVLLDWAEPWAWLRQLRGWVRALRALKASLDGECAAAWEENMRTWREGRRGAGAAPSTVAGAAEDLVSIPLGPGEWDSPLGLPVVVVAQNADRIEALEKERGWVEEEFDTILQYLRTVLLKHGAALLYAMPSTAGTSNAQVQALVHSALGITNLLGGERAAAGGAARDGGVLKHNVIDRERVLVPMGWDSWGKIRLLRDGFQPEDVSSQWDVDVNEDEAAAAQIADEEENGDEVGVDGAEDRTGAVALYEDIIMSPDAEMGVLPHANGATGIEVESIDHQEFLKQQLKKLEEVRVVDEREKAEKDKSATAGVEGRSMLAGSGGVEDHIGPVQFNVGGIQVDADRVVRQIKDRNATPTPETPVRERSDGQAMAGATPGVFSPDSDGGDASLMSFFQGLAKRKGTGSPASTPQR